MCLPTHFGYPLITISSYCAYFPVLKTLTFGYTFQRMSSAHFAHLTCFPPNFTSLHCSFRGLVCVFALSLFGVYRFYFILACCAIPSGVCLHTLQAIRLYRRCSLSPVHVRPSGLPVAILYHVSPWFNIYFCCKFMHKSCKNYRFLENSDISLKIIFWQVCDRIVKEF